MKEKQNVSKYSMPQRIGAIVCVVLLVLIYIAALVFNLLDVSWAQTVGRIALISTFVLPLLAWFYIWMIGNVFRKHTIADFDLGGVPTNHSGATIVTNADDKDADGAAKQE